MTTGVYTKTFGEICRDALRDAGIVAVERPINAPHLTMAQSKANDILALWQAKNLPLWLETEALLPLNPNQSQYTLGPDGDHCFTNYVYATSTAAVAIAGTVIPCSVTTGMTLGDFVGVELSTNARQWSTISVITPGVSITIADQLTAAVNSGATIYTYTTKIDRPVRVLGARGATQQVGSEQDMTEETRQSYYKIVNKTDVSSDVNSWYYSPQLTNGKFSIWQSPRNCTQLVRFTFVKPQYVNQDQTEDVLIPAEWFLAFKWAVSYELGVTYAIDPNRLISIAQKASDSYNLAFPNDEEYDSFNFQPG